eukprot:3656665-Pleurochrysis_carterae.AAC.1
MCIRDSSGTTPDATPAGLPLPPSAVLPLPPSTLPPFVPIVRGQYDNPYFGIRSYLLPLPPGALPKTTPPAAV